MTLLVKNHLASEEIVSRDIKMDSGDELSYYSVNGNGSLTLQNKNDSDDSNSKIVINFDNTSSVMTGTVYSLNDGETIENASNKLIYTIDKNTKTDMGIPVSQFDLVTKNDGSNADYNVTISSDSGKTKIVTVMKDAGKAQFTQTTTLSASNEMLKVPDFDKSNSIDPVTEESKLSKVYSELETNLSSIMEKMGISPSL
jgi:hypothetical protein